jgi:hypothetical protein
MGFLRSFAAKFSFLFCGSSRKQNKIPSLLALLPPTRLRDAPERICLEAGRALLSPKINPRKSFQTAVMALSLVYDGPSANG